MTYTIQTPTGREYPVTADAEITGPIKLRKPVSGAEFYFRIGSENVGVTRRVAEEYVGWKASTVRTVSRREIFRSEESQFPGRGAGGW